MDTCPDMEYEKKKEPCSSGAGVKITNKVSEMEDLFQRLLLPSLEVPPALRLTGKAETTPVEGYYVESTECPEHPEEKAICIAASYSRLPELVFGLYDMLPDAVTMIFEQGIKPGTLGLGPGEEIGERSYQQENIETYLVKSRFFDFERLLLGCGYTGLSVCDFISHEEVFIDQHKLVVVYTCDVERFRSFLGDFGLCEDDRVMDLYTEAVPHEHVRPEGWLDEAEAFRMLFNLERVQGRH